MDIKKVSFSEINPDEISTELYNALDDTFRNDPDSYLFEATYEYGEVIVDDGKFVNSSGNYADELNYGHIPVCSIIDKNIEIYVENNHRIIPLDMYQPHDIFGTYETLDYLFGIPSKSFWSLSAGGRYIFPMRKLTNSRSFGYLNKSFGKVLTKPSSHADYFEMFKEIIRQLDTSWRCRLYIIPKRYLDDVKLKISQNKGNALYNAIVQKNWSSVNISIETIKDELIWEKLFSYFFENKITINHYQMDTLKHIVSIAKKKKPGFIPVNSENYIPLKAIKEVFESTYKLDYPFELIGTSPIANSNTVYYSLLFPTLLGGSLMYAENERSISVIFEKLTEIIAGILDDPSRINMDHQLAFYSSLIKDNELIKDPNQAESADLSHADNISRGSFWKAVVEFTPHGG
jgi:hypothetical protein